MPNLREIAVACADVQDAIAAYEDLGFRLDMIMPADAPRLALMSAAGLVLKLELDGVPAEALVETAPAFTLADAGGAWSPGRAGMQYRDLIPGRLGGRVIASQIRIPDGGPVNDYVHYHRVAFQMIYCRRGWVRVVYEDQGPPFVMHEGDCVLQPPTIRHRVLESSPGLEVIEVSAPAEHETLRDHDLALPTKTLHRERSYGGQHFVHRVASGAEWQRGQGFTVRDTGIATATGGLAGARVLRASAYAASKTRKPLFLMVLAGNCRLNGETSGAHLLAADDACVIPADAAYTLQAGELCELLEVALPL